MIPEQKVWVCASNNVKKWEELGYYIPKRNKKNDNWTEKKVEMNLQIQIDVSDIPPCSTIKIIALCDYCGKEYTTTMNSITRGRKIINKDTCLDCVKYKRNDAMKVLYGVENAFQSDYFNDKKEKTMIERYGAAYTMHVPEIKSKIEETNIERYGHPTPFGNSEILQKTRDSLYLNGTAPCSQQQKHLHDILGGELNYPQWKTWLDIAFVDQKIYIEYDGGGHKLSVICKMFTEKEFRNREIRRYYALKRAGWKQIKIISRKDIMYTDIIYVRLFQECKDIFKSDKDINWITIDVDKNELKTKFNKYILDIDAYGDPNE